MSNQKKTSFSLLFYPSKTKLKKNGEAPVLMRININGDRAVLNLKRSIQPALWNTEKGRMAGRSQEAKVFNDYIDAVVQRTRQKYSELLVAHDLVTPQMLRDAVLGVKNANSRMIVEVFEARCPYWLFFETCLLEYGLNPLGAWCRWSRRQFPLRPDRKGCSKFHLPRVRDAKRSDAFFYAGSDNR